jgi:hypothetical protein
MKKLVKVLLALVLVAMLCFGPALASEAMGDPGPDDRPISYVVRPRKPRA